MKFSTTNRELRSALAHMRPIIDNAWGGTVLHGVQLEVREGVITLAATDRYRLLIRRLEHNTTGGNVEDGKCIVDPIALQRALRLRNLERSTIDDVVTIKFTGSAVEVRFHGGTQVTLPIIAGDYPDLWKVIQNGLPKEGDEADSRVVRAEYARNMFPPSHGWDEVSIAAPVGDKGYVMSSNENMFSMLVPIGRETAPFKVPGFVKERLA